MRLESHAKKKTSQIFQSPYRHRGQSLKSAPVNKYFINRTLQIRIAIGKVHLVFVSSFWLLNSWVCAYCSRVCWSKQHESVQRCKLQLRDGSHFAQNTTTNPYSLFSSHTPLSAKFQGYLLAQNTPNPIQIQHFSCPEFESGQNEWPSEQPGPQLGKMIEKWTKLF